MESQEKQIIRARLIASGIAHWWPFDGLVEVSLWLEILAEELAKIEDESFAASVRDSLRRCGLDVPEVRLTQPLNLGRNAAAAEGAGKSSENKHEREQSASLYSRRAPNQISEYTEAHIRELLGRGLSKSAVARALRVNRRVVIRVAQEAQSAQQQGLTKV